MKYIQKLFLLISLLSLFSCSREELGGEGAESPKALRLVITAEGMGMNSKSQEPGTEEETRIDDLYIYCFSDVENRLLFKGRYEGGLLPFRVDLPESLPESDSFLFYAYASTNGVTMPGLYPAQAELDYLQTPGMCDYTGSATTGRLLYPAERKIPMAAAESTNGISNESLLLPLKRCVSKLRVRIVNKIAPGKKIELFPDEIAMQVKNVRSSTRYIRGYVSSALFTSQSIEMAAHNEMANGEKWVYCYLNEQGLVQGALPADRMSLELRVPYSVDGGPKATYSYEVPMDFPFERNYIYQLIVNVYGDGTPVRAAGNEEGLATRINTSWDVKRWGE